MNNADQGRTAWTSRAFACLLPLVIVIGGLAVIRGVPPPVDTELRDELVEAMDEHPDVVVIGNSITKAGIDPERLAAHLGLRVELLTVPGSEAPAWYAVVKNIVLRAPRPPRLILVANRADGLLAVSARTEQDQLRLDQLMTAYEPVLAAKVLARDARSVLVAELDRRRNQHRRAILDGLRNVAAALVGQRPEDAVSAHNRVFADHNVDLGLAGDAWVVPGDADVTTDPPDSLVVDLADLAAKSGIKIAFVNLPSAPGVPDLVTEDQMHALVRLMNERAIGYVARPKRPMRAAWFSDPVHFRPVGREHYTTFLAKRILKLKLHLPNVAVPAAPLPLRPPTVARTGLPRAPRSLPLTPRPDSCAYDAPPQLVAMVLGFDGPNAPITPGLLQARGLPPAWPVTIEDPAGVLHWIPRPWRLRRECRPGSFAVQPSLLSVVPRGPVTLRVEGQPTVRDPDEGAITWIVPGTTLTLSATDPWDDGPPAFQLLAHTFGSDAAPEVVLRDVGPVALASHGGAWRALAQGGPPDWELTVRSEPGGPLVAVHSLAVGLGARRTAFLASGRNPDQLALDIVGRPLPHTRPEWTTPVPAVPSPVDLVWNRDGTATFEAPEVIDLTDRLTGRCSPLAVLEDGRPLERHVDCDDVRTDPGTQCHLGTQIRFHPRPGQASRARYQLVFDRTSGRACNTALWLLPRDVVHVTASRQEQRRFFEGPRELHLTARRFGPTPSKDDVAVVRLERGDADLLQTAVGIEELEHGLVIPIEEPLSPLGEPIRITIHNRSVLQALLFQKATLVESLASPGQTARVRP